MIITFKNSMFYIYNISALRIVNKIIQIFFIRIYREYDPDLQKNLKWGIGFGVIPFTGWKHPFKYISKKPVYWWFKSNST